MAVEERDPMIDIYVNETFQLIEQLETIIIDSEQTQNMDEAINEIFRNMHTIKGNSMMMKYDNIAELAHALEDLFDYLRSNDVKIDNYSNIVDLVLSAMDFFKSEVIKVQNDDTNFESAKELIKVVNEALESIKFMAEGFSEVKEIKEDVKEEAANQSGEIPFEVFNLYHVNIIFEDGCQMENIRAFSVVNQLEELQCDIFHFPTDLEDFEEGLQHIKNNGFQLALNCKQEVEELEVFFSRVSFLKEIDIKKIDENKFKEYMKLYFHYKNEEEEAVEEVAEVIEEVIEEVEKKVKTKQEKPKKSKKQKQEAKTSEDDDNNTVKNNVRKQKYINVDVEKLDGLMNLLGELVVSESMVTKNPEILSIKSQDIDKAVNQMRKNINEIQDIVMAIRMVPLSMTFQRMNRIIRDVSVKQNKEIDLTIIGQETEVDKNIIEHITDPLMHLIRNAIDHGIESKEDRLANGKSEKGKITLEAKNAGGDVWIIIKDDGKGLDKEAILDKASDKGLLKKPREEYTEKEAFGIILEAGFSTRETVTNFSGRGVGMDVVVKGLEKISGNVIIESELGVGTSMILRIPLTLAIVDSMLMNVGESKLALPITSIKESFKPNPNDLVEDPEGREMILVRGEVYSVVRFHERYDLDTGITNLEDGILIMLSTENRICIFVDSLIGEHQVVVKNFSKYIQHIQGITGCAHLGDGGICLIVDPSNIAV